MRLTFGALAYLLVAALLVVLGFAGLSNAISPPRKGEPAARTERRDEFPTASRGSIASKPANLPSPERVPVWIAPTEKYPASAFNVNSAARAKQTARSPASRDWRLRERDAAFETSSGMSSFAPSEARSRGQGGQPVHSHQDPIQFRERTEPR